ncbi:MAG: phycobilisome rod-core linker polypeptide [Cyanobacteria bacterium P01_C01_bin.72]
MKNSLFNPEVSRRKLNFNPEGFDLAKAIAARKTTKNLVEPQQTQLADKYLNAFNDFKPIELIDSTSVEEQQIVINAAYKQVFGNAYLMESERLPVVESQLCSGEITVMEFIRQLAKSPRYRSLFFDTCTNVRAIELNFKHLLGRAPENYQEISQHIQILADGGFEAEIDSYLDSDEYFQNFGTNIVPYYRGYSTQTGKSLAGYTHSFELLRGASSSDKSNSVNSAPKIQSALLQNQASEIAPLSGVPESEPILTPLKPVKVKYEPFKDLEIRSIGSSALKAQETSVSPATWLQQFNARKAAATFPAARLSQPVKLYAGAKGEEAEVVIRAAYKQVFGNAHLLESQRALTAESRLKDGQLTVREFIREIAKSDAYRSIFFESCSNIRAIELNFKHLLGRTPNNAQELAEHSAILLEQGWWAEIDSYLDSSEYKENFGEDTVPYYVAYSSQTGKNVDGYNRIFQLMNGCTSSDRSVGNSIAASTKSQLQKSLFKLAPQPIILKPLTEVDSKKGFGSLTQRTSPTDLTPAVSEAYTKAFADCPIVELVDAKSVTQQDLVIEAAYKQVFGNAHLMESERSPQLESQLRGGEITVMEFVRQLAKSERYRALFLEKSNNLKAIELNFKHLLGRSPENSAEISQHIQILVEQGWSAEIDSYLDSDEYTQNFGTTIVPYYRGYQTQTGKDLTGYTRSFQLLPGASSSDKSISKNSYTQLEKNILSDCSNPITPLTLNAGSDTVFTAGSGTVFLRSNEIPPSIPKPPRKLTQSEYPTYQSLSSTQRAIINQNDYRAAIDSTKIKFVPGGSSQEAELAIRALYKQILGNAYVMESERFITAESQLKQGNITVREFVRRLAKSELYQSRFIYNCPRYRSHELNFKHLLGRAPDSYQETIEHSNTLDSQGYEADIDSYIDSEEYLSAFGEDTVPYYRGYNSLTGKSLLGYTNMLEMLDSASTSDKANKCGNKPRLQEQLMTKQANVTQAPQINSQPVTDTVSLIRKVLNLI